MLLASYETAEPNSEVWVRAPGGQDLGDRPPTDVCSDKYQACAEKYSRSAKHGTKNARRISAGRIGDVTRRMLETCSWEHCWSSSRASAAKVDQVRSNFAQA